MIVKLSAKKIYTRQNSPKTVNFNAEKICWRPVHCILYCDIFAKTLCEHLLRALFSMYPLAHDCKIWTRNNDGAWKKSKKETDGQANAHLYKVCKYFSHHVRKRRYTREDATCSSMMPYNASTAHAKNSLWGYAILASRCADPQRLGL